MPRGRRAATEGQLRQEPLRKLLNECADGRIQIPEFQRDIRLTDAWIVSLLASVSLDYPIGALTFLEAGAAVADEAPRA